MRFSTNSKIYTSGNYRMASYVLLAALFIAPVITPVLHAADGFAGTADEATVEALNMTGEDAKILSVSEQEDFFKVKVLAEGKVKVIKIPKPDGA